MVKGVQIMRAALLFEVFDAFDPKNHRGNELRIREAVPNIIRREPARSAVASRSDPESARAAHVDTAKTSERDVKRLGDDAIAYVQGNLEP
jgi:hypothetical protein